MKSTRNKYFQIEFLVTLFFLQAMPAFGIVLHPDGEPNLATWTDRPDANVVGRWSSNASFVVIAPNWIVTTRHQNTDPATVLINGVSYTCHYNITDWTGGPTGNADIRLIRLTKADGNDANLPHYARPYEYDDEAGKDVVIGGYGRGRGDPNTVFYRGEDYVIGYKWAISSNTTQRWCQNTVDGYDIAGGTYTSQLITADFDGLGDDEYQPYEGMVALYDSGGGWFIYDSNEWKVAGLSHGVTAAYAYESTFRSSIDPREPAPDGMDAIRISAYAQWIKQIIRVDFADFVLFANNWQRTDCNSTNYWCDGADFIPHDGTVDWEDLTVFADRWLTAW